MHNFNGLKSLLVLKIVRVISKPSQTRLSDRGNVEILVSQ